MPAGVGHTNFAPARIFRRGVGERIPPNTHAPTLAGCGLGLLRHHPAGAEVAGPGESALLDFVGRAFGDLDDGVVGANLHHPKLRHRRTLQVKHQSGIGDILHVIVDEIHHAAPHQQKRLARAVRSATFKAQVFRVFNQHGDRLWRR